MKPKYKQHKCDDRCMCPIHGIAMHYSPSSDTHACQNPDCEFAHGFEKGVNGNTISKPIEQAGN